MDIIESLFYETEKKANLFLIDSRKYNRFTSSYKKEKIKELLVAYGSYPIHSINIEHASRHLRIYWINLHFTSFRIMELSLIPEARTL